MNICVMMILRGRFTRKGVLVDDGVDQEDAHGASVVGGGDGLEALLAGGVPDLELDQLPVELDRADLEVDPDGGDEGRVEGVLGEPDQEATLPHGRVSDHEQLQQVVIVFFVFGHLVLLVVVVLVNVLVVIFCLWCCFPFSFFLK